MNLPLRVRLAVEGGRVTGTVTHDPDNQRWIAYLNLTDEVAFFATPDAAYGFIHQAMTAEHGARR